ncbi:MAG: glycerophosphodiester phosphodiesterase [Nitrospiraceae bacterium]
MILRIGHRGAAGHMPENSLGSIQRAIELGVDFVEIDLRRTQDGHLVILHDERVDRTTDGTGAIATLTLNQVKKLRMRDGQRIPTLEEVLEIADRRVGLMLELKTTGLAEQVVGTVQRVRLSRDVIYASFLHSELLRLRRMAPSAKTLALLKKGQQRPNIALRDPTHVGVGPDGLTSRFVSTMHAAGLQVVVFTLNDPTDIERAKALGVDGIISDCPERV